MTHPKLSRPIALLLITITLTITHHSSSANTATNLTSPTIPATSPIPSTSPSTILTNRPASWATPLTAPGLPNFFKVSDTLYRSAQPTAAGFSKLPGLGIKTVVNLREFHDDTKLIRHTGLAYEHIKFATWHPETEDIIRFLKIATDTNATPVLVHCQHGADRTGTMCALYRIVVQNWTKEEAIKEMTGGNFGFHTVWDNLIQYIREIDVAALKNQLH